MNKALTEFQIMEIQTLSLRGMSASLIAEQLDLGVSVVKKWLSRTRRGISLPTQRGRPAKGPLSSFPPELKKTILGIRSSHPGWGPIQLQIELKKHSYWSGEALPSRDSIARLLLDEKVTRAYQRHAGVETELVPKPEHPHDYWQMDASNSIFHLTIISNEKTTSYDFVRHIRSRLNKTYHLSPLTSLPLLASLKYYS